MIAESKKMFSFEKLEVWQKTRDFLKGIYKATALFPKKEQFGLSQHIRKSAISLSSNIAEATSRFGNVDFKRFIEIAIGSLYEAVSQLFIAAEFNPGDGLSHKPSTINYKPVLKCMKQ